MSDDNKVRKKKPGPKPKKGGRCQTYGVSMTEEHMDFLQHQSGMKRISVSLYLRLILDKLIKNTSDEAYREYRKDRAG